MNRRGFLRFFGAMPAAAAATVVAPVTHADVAALADQIDVARMQSVDGMFRIDLLSGYVEYHAAAIDSIQQTTFALQSDLHSIGQPAARLIVAPPPKALLVYEPPEEGRIEPVA